MKYLIPILFLLIGCGVNEEHRDEVDARYTSQLGIKITADDGYYLPDDITHRIDTVWIELQECVGQFIPTPNELMIKFTTEVPQGYGGWVEWYYDPFIAYSEVLYYDYLNLTLTKHELLHVVLAYLRVNGNADHTSTYWEECLQ